MPDKPDKAWPYIVFFPSDYMGDPNLRQCSPAARGVWMDMICFMHMNGKPYGHLSMDGTIPLPPERLARLVGETAREVKPLLVELEEAGVFSKTVNGVIYSRRMVMDRVKKVTAVALGKQGQEEKKRRLASVLSQASPQASPQATPQATREASSQEHTQADAGNGNGYGSGFGVGSSQGSTGVYVLAGEVLAHLNEQTGAAFVETYVTTTEIAARLTEVGDDLEGVKRMVSRQVAKWKNDPQFADKLRPRTLFDSDLFHQYYGLRDLPVAVDEKNARPPHPSAINGRLAGIASKLRDLEKQTHDPDAREEIRKLKREQEILEQQQKQATQ